MTLAETVAETLKIEPAELTDESRPANTTNWDSLRHIEVMMAIEVAFDVTFSMAEMSSMRHLGDIATLLRQKGREPGPLPQALAAA